MLMVLGAIVVLTSVQQSHGQQKAFPGAEGGGMYTAGGRGGKVIEVTNLLDNTSPGSLRYAVNQSGARTVVFRISGTITLTSELKISRDSITIAGQTAPGDGICLRKYPLSISANQVIVRYLRVRLGDENSGESDAISGFTNSSTGYKNHIIIDHCSASWSQDECVSVYGNEYVTVQWCIISESLYNSSHPKGAHGYGGIWGGRDHATFHHNLIAHHSSRNPRLSGSTTTTPTFNVDIRNNVIYNWGFNSAYGGEGGTGNFVNNYYKPGPATKSGVRSRIFQPSDTLGRWFIEGNVVEGNPTVTADNWAGGVNPSIMPKEMSSIKALVPFISDPVTTQTAAEAFSSVVAYAGASFPVRDSIDRRIVAETTTGTVTFGGITYAKEQKFDTTKVYGIIDSQSNVGGWPLLASAPAPPDTDHDGMPDAWELAQGLNPADPADRNLKNAQEYTKLEEYLNSLVAGTVVTTTGSREHSFSPDFVLHQNYPNPFNPETRLSYTLSSHGPVALRIYDLRGSLVRELIHVGQAAGRYSIRWDGRDAQSRNVSSGVYIAQLVSQGTMQSRKLLLVR